MPLLELLLVKILTREQEVQEDLLAQIPLYSRLLNLRLRLRLNLPLLRLNLLLLLQLHYFVEIVVRKLMTLIVPSVVHVEVASELWVNLLVFNKLNIL